ncbi:hypothetical protein NQ318_011387 [Aromia moschata]|uniref:UDP-glucuronosyltransferase n=1 Tax=Aromia moschata TaxID=1265417 RepID=A0AAV8YUD2_9CUCU|nr:hypothetical protein NQ318_011387 [Aromia moschata]
MSSRSLPIALIFVSFLGITQCARILGVFPFPVKSHYILGNALMRGLAEAGHDVTMISPFEDTGTLSRGTYSNIVLTGFSERYEEILKHFDLLNDPRRPISAQIMFQHIQLMTSNATLGHPNVIPFLNSGEKFDAVIVEQFVNEAVKVFAYHFQAPLILFCSVGPNNWINSAVGNPSPLSYIPYLMDYPIIKSFTHRVVNTLIYIAYQLMNYFYVFPKNEDILRYHFADPPNFYELYHNASLALLNSHGSISQAVPLVPTMKEIGGFHVKPPKKLPKDLQDYLDNAKDGVVYFSLGSSLRSKDLPLKKLEALLRSFGKLKQKVLWKWEEDILPGQPANVKLGKWFPQQDILAHPNVILFVTQGGLLSNTESVYHGVPMLVIPVYGDQHHNARLAMKYEYSLTLPYKDPEFSEEKISYLLNELLHNPKYSENVKRISRLFHDRPLSPMEEAVYWVEYVIRHKGALHLRVAGVDLPWYRYFLLDVILFLAVTAVLSIFLLYLGLRYSFVRRRQSQNEKMKKN